MPFSGADARAPLGAGWPELILPDGELSVDDAAIIYGVGATMSTEPQNSQAASTRKRRWLWSWQ